MKNKERFIDFLKTAYERVDAGMEVNLKSSDAEVNIQLIDNHYILIANDYKKVFTNKSDLLARIDVVIEIVEVLG